MAMKLYTGWVMSAGLVLAATAAHAQALAPYGIGRSPYAAASDIDGPYVAVPQEVPVPRYYPYERALLSPPEIYAIVRDSGFSPLGILHQRGLVYIIAAIDRGGDDGRLVIDGRTGRIIRFMPAYRMGDNFNEDMMMTYGPGGPLPPVSAIRGPPRPPLPIPRARVASGTPMVPVPRAAPLRAGEVPRAGEIKPLAAKPAPEPAQQSAAVQAKPAEPQTVPQTVAPAVVESKPAPQIQPTQEMPKVQGLE
jgi:hypothetical protein